jgi:hypothetical protein
VEVNAYLHQSFLAIDILSHPLSISAAPETYENMGEHFSHYSFHRNITLSSL